MAKSSLEQLVNRKLDAGAAGRLLDLRIDLRLCMCPRCDRPGRVDEGIYTAGGQWDRKRKEFIGDATTSRILRLVDSQVEAARWLAAWLRAHKAGEHVLENGRPCFSVGLVGGRRSGKSDLGIDFAVTYAADMPRSIVWIVLPSYPDMPEVERKIEELLPRGWYRSLGEPWYVWTLENGSEIYIKSSDDPEDLRRGRCDVAIIHEAQKQAELTYTILRPAVADRGGLVVLIGNPPRDARGEWVAEWVEKAKAGTIGARVFEFDRRLNPHIDQAALDGLKDELDERSYAIDIEGQFLPRTDVVLYAFSDAKRIGNVDVPPGPDRDVTKAFTERRLGKPFDIGHGIDWGKPPHMAAATFKLFSDPDDPSGDPIIWYLDYVLLDQGNENDLVEALEARSYRDRRYCGKDDLVIADASGEWQNSERTKGRGSCDMLRRRGWTNILLPQKDAKVNPHVDERLALANSLMKSTTGRRKFRVAPHCLELIRALKRWPNRKGTSVPDKGSEFAHLCDAATYPPCRLFPRRAARPSAGVETVPVIPRNGGWETLERLR